MKVSITKCEATHQTPVFPRSILQLQTDSKEAAPNPESQTMREDCGFSQIKKTRNSQTFFRICGNFSL